MPACKKQPDWRPPALGLALLVLTACSPAAGPYGFDTIQVDPSWRSGELQVAVQQDLSLSGEAREALQHGVPLTLQLELVLRDQDARTRLLEQQYRYEIRYLPMSDHYRLESDQDQQASTYPRLRHVLAELARLDLELPTGVLPSGDYEVLVRSSLDRQELPPPMRLPALFSGEWQHDSNWSAWPMTIDRAVSGESSGDTGP